ncbi:amidohydrolase family protein [Neptunicella marina]|uniref:Amidohydrolase family protein n=1 Tax=Neptunicella marina TaxID=2125989 RepID=A0A8J6IU15_9ALTE|nr:amidohydrolase family protein [Neptunicella marina]MBC3765618.1 amidohydrolase family protein [Neptunicella marina]
MHYQALIASVISCCISLTCFAQQADVVIEGGRVIDPETQLDAIRNVVIANGKIVAVTEQNVPAKQVIDASGLVVSPGFIDMHAHGQSLLSGRIKALDGITTALELESGALPVSAFYDKALVTGRAINYGASVNWANARISAFVKDLPQDSDEWFEASMNKINWQSLPADKDQLTKILADVQQGLDEGGLGIGFLLGYAPGTGYKEYYQVSKLAADAGVPTYTHARYLSMMEPNSSFEAMAEIVGVAASTGVHAHIVHLNSISLRDISLIGPMIKKAQQSGIDISTEAYPYGAGSTSVGSALFRGRHWREKVGGISAHNFELNGKRLSEEQLSQLQKDSPGTEVVIHLLDTSNPTDQQYLDDAVLFENGVIASDGMPWMRDGKRVDPTVWPLPKDAFSHPRSAGSFARFLRVYVRERHKVSLAEAIAKLSYGPAHILEKSIPQMRHKGRIQVGADADIIVFNPDTVTDKATFSHPAQTSVGFEFVLVNGVVLVKSGELDTNVKPGQPIRNPIKHPSQQ